MPHNTCYYFSELEEAERTYVQSLIGRMTIEQIQIFMNAYRQRRKDPQTVLLASIIGLVAIPGFQRFLMGEVVVGLLFLFTWGGILVGSISDLVSYKTLTLFHNQRVARAIADNM